MFDFESWWDSGFGAKLDTKRAMLSKLSAKLRSEYIPHIRGMFKEADTDKSGELDRPEFEAFYPKLREYLGYDIPPVVQCMNDIDSSSQGGGVFQNGLIEYEEFETWFLAQELNRAHATADQAHRK